MKSGHTLPDDRVYSGSAPYPDLAKHFRKLAKFFIPAAVIAGLIGVAVYFAANNTTPSYRAWVTAQVDAQIPVVPGDGYLYQMTGPYIALLVSDPVQQSVAAKMGPGWDRARVAANLTVNPDRSPWLININAVAPTREEALKLGLTAVQSLDEIAKRQRVVERQAGKAAQVQAPPNAPAPDAEAPAPDAEPSERDRINGLSVLAAPNADAVYPTETPSKTVAVFAALVALILSAEAMVWANGRFGKRLSVAAAERVAARHNAALYLGKPGVAEMPPVVKGLIARRIKQGEHTVLLTSPRTDASVRAWANGRGRLSVVQADSDWASQPIDPSTLVVMVAGRNEKNRTVADEAIETASELGTEPALVLLADKSSRRSAPEPDSGERTDAPASRPVASGTAAPVHTVRDRTQNQPDQPNGTTATTPAPASAPANPDIDDDLGVVDVEIDDEALAEAVLKWTPPRLTDFRSWRSDRPSTDD